MYIGNGGTTLGPYGVPNMNRSGEIYAYTSRSNLLHWYFVSDTLGRGHNPGPPLMPP